MRVVWLDSAVNDVCRLRHFIGKKNPNAAQRAALTLIKAANTLEMNPLLGKPVEKPINYRDFVIRFGARGYILRYRIHHEVIYIVSIRHCRENEFKDL